ncbi:MAG: PAS domain-containing protein [Myxococcales bacterium]|nr:PAS domain-containing protein [Myxococcales bacterium]
MVSSRRKLLWQLYASYLGLTLLGLILVAYYVLEAYRDVSESDREQALLIRARLVVPALSGPLDAARQKSIESLIRQLAQQTDTRLTLIMPDGRVYADSHADAAHVENHGDRPEVRAALRGEIGRSARFSSTVKQDRIYVAIPLRREGRIVAVVRASMTVSDVNQLVRALVGKLTVAGIVILLVSAFAGWFVFIRIRRPLDQVREGAERFARGDLRHRIEPPDLNEVAVLADTMNEMAHELQSRIELVTRQKDELETVLSSMVEGVLLIDINERIVRCNEAAALWLGDERAKFEGRFLQEAIRDSQMTSFVARVLEQPRLQEEIVTVNRDGEKHLQVHGARLQEPSGKTRGALVVMHDISNLKRLEQVRRDFVANVSHELKTPITTIKGFVETLLDGALDDREAAQRFLQIIMRHTDRLTTIIEDLLSLSRIEQGEEAGSIEKRAVRVESVLTNAVSYCRARAEEKEMSVQVACAEGLELVANPEMLEQAVVNLIDNAIKYSHHGDTVHVGGALEAGDVVVTVRDHGRGIDARHLPRLFERFYRVDKARSRAEGGTGLGLAIVKHIVQAHSGRVSVQSRAGSGTLFTIRIPSGSSAS